MLSLTSNRTDHSVQKRLPARFAAPLVGVCLLSFSSGCTRPPAVPPPSAAVAPSTLAAKVQSNPTDITQRLALADEYVSTGEIFAAIEQMEVARTLGAKDATLLRNLAQRYDSLGEPEMAAEVLASAGANEELALPLAELYLKLGDFQRSAQALQPLHKNWAALPSNTRQAIVRATLLAGDAEAAARLLASEAGADAEWRSLAGLQALLAGQPRQAGAALQQALALDPRDTWNAYLLGKAWLAAGDSERALELWSQVSQGQDPPPQAVIGAAGLLAQSGRLDAADTLLDRIRGDDRKLPAYWKTTALIAERRQHAAVAQVSLGYSAYNEGDPWQAEAIWQTVLHQADSDLARQIYIALSNSAIRRGDGQAALQYAAAAVKLGPSDPAILRQYSESLLAQSQLPAAQAAASHFQAVAPPEQQAQAAELLARIALDSSKPDLLQQSVQRGRTLAPTDPLPLLHLAEWQGQQGHDPANLERTLTLYQEAQQDAPTNAEATARAGLVLADLKRPAEATSTLLHALTLNPRVLDGAPSALLTQLNQQQGKTYESQFEAQWYQRMRDLKETWPTLLKAMRQEHPAPGSADWQALGEMALRRHENWLALCAFTRRVRLSPVDPAAWRELAAAQKRFGWFEEALDAMRKAQRLTVSSGKRAAR
jgi:tetratricopeptide (TPR) repeat protein